jgi:hypothetical protein
MADRDLVTLPCELCGAKLIWASVEGKLVPIEVEPVSDGGYILEAHTNIAYEVTNAQKRLMPAGMMSFRRQHICQATREIEKVPDGADVEV